MKKKLAIIGANESICVLIKKASSLGYETHVFSRGDGEPGEKLADFFYPIDISNKDSILEKCKQIGICGVCSITSDFAAPIVAYISRKLGLPGNPEETDFLARNKYEMRKAFQENGILNPAFFETSDVNFNRLPIHMAYPVIVKPTDRWSSKGVSRVDCENDLNNAIRLAIDESLEKRAIVEEFISGPEYSAECIVFNGIPHVVAFTKKKTTGSPHYIETGHEQPSDIAPSVQKRIIPIIKKAISSLRITNSAAHAEFRISKDKVYFMEIGARMGGDCIGTHLTTISTGIDYVKMVIDVACGVRPDFKSISEPRFVMVNFILSKKDYDCYLELKNNNAYKIIESNIYDLDFSKEVIDSSTRHGYYVCIKENLHG